MKIITKVVFRKYNDSEIIALFPYINEKNYSVLSYMHMGQHSVCDYNEVIKQTKLATEQEYENLKIELENIGYNLQVIKKAKVRF